MGRGEERVTRKPTDKFLPLKFQMPLLIMSSFQKECKGAKHPPIPDIHYLCNDNDFEGVISLKFIHFHKKFVA